MFKLLVFTCALHVEGFEKCYQREERAPTIQFFAFHYKC
jgi:hypothetical protein